MEQKNILITGISSGFGLLTTVDLLKRGHRVMGVVRGGAKRMTQDLKGDETSKIISESIASGRLIAVDADLNQPQTYSDASQWIERDFAGKLDVLIHNAGFGIFAPGHTLTEAEVRHQLEVNFIAPVLLTQKLLPYLSMHQGRILCLSSVCGQVGLPFYANYCASKFAMEGFFESLWMDLRKMNVQICLIEPGGFKTEFNKKLLFGAVNFDQKRALTRVIQEKTRTVGQPAERVVRTLVRLCFRKRIPLRVSRGLDARMLLIARWLLPSTFFAFLVERAFQATLNRYGGNPQ